MTLKFTNEQIYFVLEPIWGQLDYRFKYQINELVSANSADDYEQTLTVDLPTLNQCYKAMSYGSYGCTTDMADILLPGLRDQLIDASNMTEYQAYLAAVAANEALPEEDREEIEEVIPNEYTQALISIASFKDFDMIVKNRKILNGKAQILA